MHLLRFFPLLICVLFFEASFAQDSTIKVIEAYSLTNISEAFDESEKELRALQDKLEKSEDIDGYFNEFHSVIEKAAALRTDTAQEKIKKMSLNSIKDLRSEWTRHGTKIKKIEDKVSELNQELEKQKEKLEEYKKRWLLTQKVSNEREVTEVINARITKGINEIELLDNLRTSKQAKCFILLDSLTEEGLFIADMFELLSGVEKELRTNIFTKDSSPYFQMTVDSTDTLGVAGGISVMWNKTKSNNSKFIEDNETVVWIHGLLFLIFVLLFVVLRSECAKVSLTEIKTFQFFEHFVRSPILSALIFGLFISFWIYDNRPGMLSEQIILLIMFPIVILLSGLYKSVFRLALLTLGLLFFLDQIQYFLSGQVSFQRNLLMAESVIGLIISAYLSFPKAGFLPQERTKNWLLIKLFPLIPMLFLFAIYQNIQGSVQFSKLITSVLIKGAAVGVILYSVVMFIQGFVELLVASEFGKKIHTIRDKSAQLTHWTKIIVGVWAGYTFFRAILVQLRLDVSFAIWWTELMEYSWEFGDASLSIGTLVDFILILIVFTVIANVSRNLLETEILPRFNLKKGIAMAVGVVVRYFILALGFFMAVAAAGINLDKLGFLAGALGVGIGFGLQNVVNNFVSGLILVFERPIHIDDVITAGEIEGVVRDVGIRASTIRTWDGAEVLVPNSELISFKVTNWTLSDTKRRREHHIKVETGTDPNKVIGLLRSVLDKNEDVIKDPEPMVLFLGQTGYSLEFRILYWISARLLLVDSELALEFYNQLERAGIKLAIPKQSMIYEGDGSGNKASAAKRTTARKKPPTPTKKKPEDA